MKFVFLCCALLLGATAPAAAQTDTDQVLALALRKVLVRDSALCATSSCKGVAIVVMAPDSVALPNPFPVPLNRIKPAQADSMRRALRTFVVRNISVRDDFAEVQIDALSSGREYSGFIAPDPPPGALPAAIGGWHVHLRRTGNGWIIDRTVEWIT